MQARVSNNATPGAEGAGPQSIHTGCLIRTPERLAIHLADLFGIRRRFTSDFNRVGGSHSFLSVGCVVLIFRTLRSQNARARWIDTATFP